MSVETFAKRMTTIRLSYDNIHTASILTRDRIGRRLRVDLSLHPTIGLLLRVSDFAVPGWDLLARSRWSNVDAVVNRWDLGIPPNSPIAVMMIEGANRQPDLTELVAAGDLFGERLFEAGEPGERRRHMILDVVEPCVADRSCASLSDE